MPSAVNPAWASQVSSSCISAAAAIGRLDLPQGCGRSSAVATSFRFKFKVRPSQSSTRDSRPGPRSMVCTRASAGKPARWAAAFRASPKLPVRSIKPCASACGPVHTAPWATLSIASGVDLRASAVRLMKSL